MEQSHPINYHIYDKFITTFEEKQKFLNFLIEKGFTTQTMLSEDDFRKLWNEYRSRR